MAKLDGTNGLIQQYDYQVLTTGFTYTFASGTQTLVANPAGTLATGTITMPAAPADGMSITIESTQTITAITVQGNTGQSIVGAPTQLLPNQPVSFIYRVTNTTWYPLAGAGASAPLVSGTAVASTSGTSIDFTSIPTWVKRITFMLSLVSTNGSGQLQIQIGSGSITSSSYQSSCSYAGGANQYNYSTTGFVLDTVGTSGATLIRSGIIIISLVGSNTWVAMGNISAGVIGQVSTSCSGTSPALGGVLDRVRLTTSNGTDAFDGGSVNILYE